MNALVARLRAMPLVRQRLIAGAILAFVVVIVPLIVLAPLLGKHLEYAEAISSSEHQLERSAQALGRMPNVEADVTGLERALERSGLYIERSSASLAAADLQQMLSDLAEQSDVSIGSSDVRSPSEGPHATRVTVRLNLSGDIDGIAELLEAIQGYEPMLLVDDLTIRPDRRRSRHRSAHEPVELDVRLDVSALMRGEGTL